MPIHLVHDKSAAVADGPIASDSAVVFLHTGGLPALFARSFATWLAEA